MAKVNMSKIAKEPITFDLWCKENRWSAKKLSEEFEKYGEVVSASSIWYWKKGLYTPRNKNVMKILSEICGFDAASFANFRKK